MTEPLLEESDRARDLISAAHALLNSDRIADEQELLLTTVVEVLAGSAMVSSEVAAAVQRIWPGAELTAEVIDSALQRGLEAGLLTTQDTLIEKAWALTPSGRAETDGTRSWYEDAIARLADQVRDRAREDFGSVTREQAQLWAGLLIDLLARGIRQMESAYEGNVTRRADGGISPVGLDAQVMFDELDKRSVSVEIATFLKSCLLGAIDEADPFGNEIVNYVATACVLTAVAARRSRADATAKLGNLNGLRMLLDTPVLVSLVGVASDAARIEMAIKAAVLLKADVVVPEHVLEELHEVVLRVERDSIGALTTALASGINTRIYRATVNDQILETFLDAAEAGRYKNWSEFRQASEQLSIRLKELGVSVRPHHNYDPAIVMTCRERLIEQLDRAGGGRSDAVIDRDAQSMAMVWRHRRRHRATSSSLWPGGWVVTTDRQMSPAFARVDPADPVAITLTPAQWATLLSECADPPAVRDLVIAAASFVREESMLAIAMRYPPKVALDLARTLNADGVSSTDTRVAQMSLEDLLDQAGGHPSLSGEKLAGRIMERRIRRQTAAADVQREELERARARSEEAREAAEAQLEAERVAREAMARQVGETGMNLAELRAQLAKTEELQPRRTARAAILTVLVMVAFVTLLAGQWWAAAGFALAAMLFHHLSENWITDPRVKNRNLAFAFLPALLSLVDALSGLAG